MLSITIKSIRLSVFMLSVTINYISLSFAFKAIRLSVVLLNITIKSMRKIVVIHSVVTPNVVAPEDELTIYWTSKHKKIKGNTRLVQLTGADVTKLFS